MPSARRLVALVAVAGTLGSLGVACGSNSPSAVPTAPSPPGFDGGEADSTNARETGVDTEAGTNDSKAPPDARMDAGADAPPPFDLASYCTAYSTALTAFGVRCGELDSTEQAALTARLAESCVTNQTRAYAGRVVYDGVAAAICLAALGADACNVDGSVLCNGVFMPIVDGTAGQACNAACATGFECIQAAAPACPSCQPIGMPQPVGATCHYQKDCDNGVGYCNSPAPGVAGFCTAWLAQGAACALGSQACNPVSDWCTATAATMGTCSPLASAGQACDTCRADGVSICCTPTATCIGSPATCVTLGKAGDTCNPTTAPCAPGFLCPSAATKVCSPPLPDGDLCGSATECASGLCNDATPRTCGKAAVGQACLTGMGAADTCATGTFCKGETAIDAGAENAGFCTAREGPGGTCDPNTTVDATQGCIAGYGCQGGVCVLPVPGSTGGAVCETAADCATDFYCYSQIAGTYGACTPRATSGACNVGGYGSSGEACAAGSACAITTPGIPDGECIPLVSKGAACGATARCKWNLACAAQVDAGSICESAIAGTGPCSSGICPFGCGTTTCNGGQLGNACQTNAECSTGRCINMVCAPPC